MPLEQVINFIWAVWIWSILWIFIKFFLDKKQVKNQRLYEFEKEFLYKKQEAFLIINNFMSETHKYLDLLKNYLENDACDLDYLADNKFFSDDREKVPWLISLYFKDNEEVYNNFYLVYNKFVTNFFEYQVKNIEPKQWFENLLKEVMLAYNEFQFWQEESLEQTRQNLHK